MDKKGIEPLAATILIIGFTVALAAVIMLWGQGFIKDMQENQMTAGTAVSVRVVNQDVTPICEDGVVCYRNGCIKDWELARKYCG